MKPYISMITLGVQDLARSIEFYEKGLSLPRFDFDGENVAFFDLNGAWLGLFDEKSLAEDANVEFSESAFKSAAIAHNLKSKQEVDAQMFEAENAGATITKPAQDVFWGGYSGYFKDPDGHLWEVAYNPYLFIGPQD